MKKICLLLCCVLLLQLFVGCRKQNEDIVEPVNFYYGNKEISYNSPAGVLRAEIREGTGYQGNLVALLCAYMTGPLSDDLESLFPSDVYLVSCAQNGDVVTVVMSSHLADVSGIKLTTACSALLQTIHDYSGANTLKIRAKGEQLEDKDELILTIDDIVLMDMVGMED